MGRKKKIVVENIRQEIKFDLSKYIIIEDKFLSIPKIYILYYGDLPDCIQEFEKKYGTIDGEIYYNGKKSVAFTGSQANLKAQQIGIEI